MTVEHAHNGTITLGETPISSETAGEGWQHGGWLEPFLGRVVVCGIVIMGTLSGFGAVRTAWDFWENGGGAGGGCHPSSGGGSSDSLLKKALSLFNITTPPPSQMIKQEDIMAAERSLYQVRHEIVSKQQYIARQLSLIHI